jgi:hypothetical protein
MHTRARAGPYDRVHLQKMLADGYVRKETPLWREGLPEWQPLAEITELAPLVQVTEELQAKSNKDKYVSLRVFSLTCTCCLPRAHFKCP